MSSPVALAAATAFPTTFQASSAESGSVFKFKQQSDDRTSLQTDDPPHIVERFQVLGAGQGHGAGTGSGWHGWRRSGAAQSL